MGFLLVFGYSFARPCIDSMFLEHYSASDLPSAWLIVSILSALIIGFYNKFNQRYAILRLYGIISIFCAAILSVLLASYFLGFVPAVFMLYVWKEIYMVVLMETYWSFADIVFSVSTARFTYGMAMAICSLGGILGNLVVGSLASVIGTKWILLFLIFLLLAGLAISYLANSISDEKPKPSKKAPKIDVGLKTLLSSKYLVPLAILACIAQVATGLIDFQFNDMLQENYLNLDRRTEALGYIHATVNIIGIVIQLLMAPILKIFGVANTFLSVPFLLSAMLIGFVLYPTFAIMQVLKIANKALDYSIFRGAKEILYIPLSREEKTQGKGIIDIFMYRLARGMSSLVLMVLVAVNLTDYVIETTLALLLAWFFLALVIGKRYNGLIKSGE